MLSPFFSGLIHLRHVSFSEGVHIVLAETVIVNEGRIKERRLIFMGMLRSLPLREHGD